MLNIEASILYAELLTAGRLKHVVIHAELVKYLAAFLEHGALFVTHRKMPVTMPMLSIRKAKNVVSGRGVSTNGPYTRIWAIFMHAC